MSVDEARIAVQRGEWQYALDLLEDLGEAGRSVEALEVRAQAAYGNGELEATISAWEGVYTRLVDEHDRVGAARAAAMIAMYLMMDTGLMAPVRGWLRRADRLLDGVDESAPHALMAMVGTYERFMSGDLDAAAEHAAVAIELGARWDVRPAVVIGQVALARVRILRGEFERGIGELDEVAVQLMSGEVDPLTTGMMYCELICAAQGLALHDRAAEWTEVMERWRHGAAFGGINGRCRVHRAEVLRLTGPCDAAEEEALGACDDLRPWMRREFGWPLAELGNIRLRRGDLDGAEEAFREAHALAWSPYPGLALVHLARGEADTAAALIAEAIAHPVAIPSKERPPFGDLVLAPLFDAQSEIAVARGDHGTARQAALGLSSVSARHPSPSLAATAALAGARAALLAGDTDGAILQARTAVAIWIEVGAPFEAAKARVTLAEAHGHAGSPDAARLELVAARDAFEQYGAAAWAAQVGRLLSGVAWATTPVVRAQRPTGPSASFHRDGGVRTVSFGGTDAAVRDLTGLRYIERLLGDPEREFHVLDLVAWEHGAMPARRAGTDDIHPSDGALPVLDEQARAAYRRRLTEVEDDIEEAERLNDVGRLERARLDREYLVVELSRALGLAGRHRSVGSTTERARTSVARSIRYSLDQLAKHHPAAAHHLRHAVRTGTYCSYSSDAALAVEWRL